MNPVLRTVLWIGAGLAVITAMAALALLWLMFGAGHGGVDIRINGQPLTLGDLPLWHGGHGAAGAGAMLLGTLVLMLVLPVLLLLALVLGALAGAAGIAGLLLAVAVVALLALSPLWLVLLLAWLVVRRRPAPATPLRS